MAPKAKTSEELLAKAVQLGREYIAIMRRDDPIMGCVRVADLRYRLRIHGYTCWLESVIVALEREGIIKRQPGVEKLLYFGRVQEEDSDARKLRAGGER